MCQALVAYYRVSTQRQGESGLGLEAQEAAVNRYSQEVGLPIVESFKEIESGSKSDRPELLKAIQRAKESAAKLVIAKMDRLTRDLHFLTGLLKSDIQFVACDNPHANKITIQILAVVAENELESISQRTKAALAAAKARGVKLGSAREGHWTGREEKRLAGLEKATKRSVEVRKRKTIARYAQSRSFAQELANKGLSLRQIAKELDKAGYKPARGGAWASSSVKMILSTNSPT